jgi:hypothetical protein
MTFPGAPQHCFVVALMEIDPLMGRVVLPCLSDPVNLLESK